MHRDDKIQMALNKLTVDWEELTQFAMTSIEDENMDDIIKTVYWLLEHNDNIQLLKCKIELLDDENIII